MPFVIFVAPFFSENAAQMIEAAGTLPDVTLGVISTQPAEAAPPRAHAGMRFHWRVDDACDAAQLVRAAQGLAGQAGRPVHRMFGALEQAQVPIAEAREALGVEGIPAAATRNFRDKARMKDVLRAAGVPCARHALVGSVEEAVAAARRIGFPLVVKPPAGAGAVGTHRVEDEGQLARAVALAIGGAPADPGRPVLLEEFIVGDEHSLETISVGGRAVWHSLTHYAPTPLDVVREPWIQWCTLLPREVDDPRYDDIRAAAARGLAALGMTTGLSHMEWFRRRDGSVAIGEVGARPPGAQFTTMISRANDIDFVQAWARVMVVGTFDPPERRYAVGTAYLRGQGQGEVRAVRGLEQVAAEVGPLVCDWRLPWPGQRPTGSYEGEGFIMVRHPETAVVEDALRRIVSRVRVELG